MFAIVCYILEVIELMEREVAKSIQTILVMDLDLIYIAAK
jgi:hypothetical protein